MFDELKEISADLEAMMYDMAVRSGIFVPINKTSFRYKKYMVLKGPDDLWHVFLLEPKKIHIATTFLKVSAFAICKSHEKRKGIHVDEIVSNDKIFQKNYTDSLFYKRTYNKTKDPISKDNALWRYEVAHAEAKQAKRRIDDIFYASIV